eukprot:TRINITY_DN15845_c0_g1_i1.p1 TRINITY_DN15845_c0_g1~~TRINITY_DN15845_c0_g1_i1.p1  ORF type:complete len:232 (+),score=102.99 TRINITY_DN15845_c0_g1_i1:85-696(+)
MAETAIGICFKDFAVLAVSGTTSYAYMKLASDEDKVYQVGSHKACATTGEQGARVQLLSSLEANMKLNQMRNKGVPHTTLATVRYLRQHMAEALRSRDMYPCNLLFAGYDHPQSVHDETEAAPSLFYLDYLAALQKVNYGVQGYGGTFVTALLDRKYKPDMSEAEGLELLKDCIGTVVKRLFVDSGVWSVKIVDKNGVRKVTV